MTQLQKSSPKQPPKGSYLGYTLHKAIFSTLIFILIYYFVILRQPRNAMQFLWIWILVGVSGIIGSISARARTRYTKDMEHSGQFISKQIIFALFYTIIVFFALLQFITDRYVDFNTITLGEFLQFMFTWPFIELILILLIIRWGLLLLSDSMADKIAFGGGR